MDANVSGTVVLNEPSSAFDPDREVKDRKLVQIFKKLHMERDLESLLRFEDDNRRSLEAVSDQSEDLFVEKVERCRPRKVVDYALLAKGHSSRNNLVGSFANSYSETDDMDKSSVSGKRIRFQKRQFEEYVPVAGSKKRSKVGQAVVSKKSSKPQRSSYPLTMRGTGKKETLRSRSFTQGIKGGILKKQLKNADNIKQAFLISQFVLVAQNKQAFDEFGIPAEWIKEAQKKKMKKSKSVVEEGDTFSVEDLAMERLVRAFKTARLLYPEKFDKYFPDFKHCFRKIGSEKNLGKKNGALPRGKEFNDINGEESATASGNNSTSDSGDEGILKQVRKMPKVSQDCSFSVEAKKKSRSGLFVEKEFSDTKEQFEVTQKSNGSSSAGISGLRKRPKTFDDTIVNHSSTGSLSNEVADKDSLRQGHSSSVGNGKKVSGHFSDGSGTNSSAAVVRNNIEDSATESSSDESSNLRVSKRQRVQSGFYKTMVTLYDNKRS